MLGHEDIKATKIYIHMARSHLREESLEHHPRKKKKKGNQ